MATYTSTSCPHCGKVVTLWDSKKTIFFGSPIRICPKCSQRFIDKRYQEPALSRDYKLPVRGLSTSNIVILIILALLFVLGVFLFVVVDSSLGIGWMSLSGFCFIAMIFSVIWDNAHFDKLLRKAQEELHASQLRIESFEYACLLKQLGYSVPEKYLIPANAQTDFNVKGVRTSMDTPSQDLNSKADGDVSEIKRGDSTEQIKTVSSLVENTDELEAEKRGLAVEQLQAMRQLERENEEFRRNEAQRQIEKWKKESYETKLVYPKFSFISEQNDPDTGERFMDMVRKGISVKTAYEVIHIKELANIIVDNQKKED